MADIINPVQKKALETYLKSGYAQLYLDKNELEYKLTYFNEMKIRLEAGLKNYNITGPDVDNVVSGLNSIIENTKNEITDIDNKIKLLLTPEFQKVLDIVSELNV